jgi:hypothetical protein
MKKLLLALKISIILLSVASLSSCEEFIFNGIEGDGPIVSREIETEKVEGITLGIPAIVYITRGDTQRMTIDAQENIQNNIECYNSNGLLKLKFNQPVFSSIPVTVHLTIQSLKEATITGSGSIVTRNCFETTEQLRINISGSGDIDLNANAQSVKILISGSGNLKLITNTNHIDAEINGSGDINLQGGYSELSEFYLKGSGNINGYALNSKSCYIEAYGSGNAKLTISEILNIKIFGSGDVYYKGYPAVSAKIGGSGKVINVN